MHEVCPMIVPYRDHSMGFAKRHSAKYISMHNVYCIKYKPQLGEVLGV